MQFRDINFEYTHPLASPLLKATWAAIHRDKAHKSFSDYFPSDDVYLSERIDGEYRVFTISVKKPPPADFILHTADAICCFRSALDHLVSRWARVERGDDKRVQFPICDEPSDFEKKKRRHLRGLSDSVVEFVERWQPFNNEDSILPAIRDLSNQDKHRVILSYLARGGIELGVEGGPGLVAMSNDPEPLKDGSVVARIGIEKADRPDDRPEWALATYQKPTIVPCFYNEKDYSGRSIFEVLKKSEDTVYDLLSSAIEQA